MIQTVFLLVFFLCVQGYFSGMETGLFSLLLPRVEHAARKGNKGARSLLYFLRRPEVMITTALVGVDIGVVLASLTTRKLLLDLEISSGVSLTVSCIALSLLILCFEIIPKNYYREDAFRRCCQSIGLFFMFYILFWGPIRIVSAFTSLVNYLISRIGKTVAAGEKEEETSPGDCRKEEFRLFLRESRMDGDVDEGTVSLLDHAMDVPGMLIEKIMIRRSKAKEIPDSMTIREAFLFCQKEDLTKVPVYDEKNAGHPWIGVFSLYKAIYEVDEEQWNTLTVADCMEMMSFLESDLKLGEVLERFRKRKILLFGVLDPNKNPVGILRPEDLSALLFQK